MSKQDIHWNIGFFLGGSAAGLPVQALGLQFHPILKVILIIGIGVSCGWMVQTWMRPPANKE